MSMINAQAAMDLFNSPEYSTRINTLITEWHVPALSISLVHNTTIESKAFGNASLNPPKPCTPSTLFDVASCSKSLTAAAVGLLVADNDNHPQFQWDTPVSTLLPDDFIMSEDDYTRRITVEDILSHRTGLPCHDACTLGVSATQPDTPKSVVRNLRNLPLIAGLRAKYQYSNLMFTVAAHLVEVVTGMAFADYLNEKFFEPLGMHSTFIQPEVAQRSSQGHEFAVAYEWSPEKDTHLTIPYENTPECVGAGNIVSTSTDYIKWVQAMLCHSAPLTPELVQDLITPRIICNPGAKSEDLDPWTSFEMYALGWEVYHYRGVRIIRHFGSIGGFSSLHFFLPEHQLGGVMFGNDESTQDVAEVVMKELVDEVLSVPQQERPDWNARKVEARIKDLQEMADERDDVLEEICPDLEAPQPLDEGTLERYTGEYWDVGYRGMKVVVNEGRLFVDASDRTCNGFLLTFEHLRGGTLFLVHLTRPFESADQEFFKAEFCIQNDVVVRMGLRLEPDMEKLIWFDRVEGS